MRREPSLTFEGALRILGRHESRLVQRLDTALGGVILAAGAGIGLAAVGGPALAPAAMFAAVWGLTDQKSEAMSLLGKAVGAVSGKLAGARGYERRQLIAAAHTTIVIAAFFESFQEQAGKAFSGLKITDAEKEALLTLSRNSGESIYNVLYAAEIPAPSPTYGFEENVVRVRDWCMNFGDELDEFLLGLSATGAHRVEWLAVLDRAVERYRSHFLALAAKVPEFMIWALLGEGAATRAQVAGMRADPDIEEWLTRWRQANAAAITAGRVRELAADCVTAEAADGSQPGRAVERLSGSVREAISSSYSEAARRYFRTRY